jgi:hypothetical protein
MRAICTSGSVGVSGEQSLETTRPNLPGTLILMELQHGFSGDNFGCRIEPNQGRDYEASCAARRPVRGSTKQQLSLGNSLSRSWIYLFKFASPPWSWPVGRGITAYLTVTRLGPRANGWLEALSSVDNAVTDIRPSGVINGSQVVYVTNCAFQLIQLQIVRECYRQILIIFTIVSG